MLFPVSFLFVVLPCIHAIYSKPFHDVGLHEDNYDCRISSKITPQTYWKYVDDIKNNLGYSCGRNRGIFVTVPPDGKTYNCAHFPESWGVEDIIQLTNLTRHPPEVLINALDLFIHSVYFSSIDKDIGACDFESLSELICGREQPWKKTPWHDKLQAPIRAVNIGGLFVIERWITPNMFNWGKETTGIVDQHSFSLNCHELGICNVLHVHWDNWYSQEDFHHMKSLNLNTIRLPVGYWYYEEISGFVAYPYLKPVESIYSDQHPITKIIRYAKNAGLQVILDLHTAPGSQNGFDNSGQQTTHTEADVWGEEWIYDMENVAGTLATVGAMATYINYIEKNFDLDNIMLFEVLNEPWSMLDLGKVRDFYLQAIERIRQIRPTQPILLHDSFRPYRWGTMMKNWPYDDVFMDNHAYHSFNVADIASNNPSDDRQKQYTHEKIGCGFKTQLHFQTCNAVPTIVGEFSLAIDNCMPFLDSRFQDYGQCSDVATRLTSPWWKDHITSFAMRQITTYERELGWAFWTYKLDSEAERDDPSSHFWSFRLAARAGFIETDNFGKNKDYCQYHPPADYVLGDDAPQYSSAGSDDGEVAVMSAAPPPATAVTSSTSSSGVGQVTVVLFLAAIVAVAYRQVIPKQEQQGGNAYAALPLRGAGHYQCNDIVSAQL